MWEGILTACLVSGMLWVFKSGIFADAEEKIGYSLLDVFFTPCLYANARAETDARDFCERMPLGADIVLEIEKFERDIGFKKVSGGKVSADHYGSPDEGFARNQHIFFFKGFMLDKGYCVVSLAAEGKITAKNSSFTYDQEMIPVSSSLSVGHGVSKHSSSPRRLVVHRGISCG